MSDEQIDMASSRKGDLVLDPFAGCAYTAVAAEKLNRQWIACDISPRALTVLRRQFAKNGWAMDGKEAIESDTMQGLLKFVDVSVLGPNDLRERDHPNDLMRSVKPLPERTYKVPSSDMSTNEMKKMLGELSDWQCWACGYATRTTSGEIVATIDHFHLDHIEPKSEGGSNFVHNRALLCGPCNLDKSNRRVPLKAFRDDQGPTSRRLSYGIADWLELPC